MPASHASPPSSGVVELFAALGDGNRLTIVESLSHDGPQSVTALARRAPITRQAVTKHLRVLETAGLATSQRHGRERVWRLEPRRLATAHRYLDLISRRWDDAIDRLEVHVHSMP